MGKKPPYSPDIEAAGYTPPPAGYPPPPFGYPPPPPGYPPPPPGYPPPPPYYHQRPHPPPPPLPRSWIPWLVPFIFIANIAMFAYSMYINNCPGQLGKENCIFFEHLGRYSFQPYKENPLLGPSTHTLRKLGALEDDLVVVNKQTWRFITSMFLHAGVIHLLANMFSLLFIGVRLEKEFGFLKIGSLYMLSGFGGSLLSLLRMRESNSNSISVGASGALFGLLGAMLSELFINWTIYANKCAALVNLIIVIGLNLAIGFLPHVDNSAHIGGFLAGFFLGFVLLIRPQFGYVNRKYLPPGFKVKRKPKYQWCQYILLVTSLIILLIGYAYGLAKLYFGNPEKLFPLIKGFPR